MKAKLTQQHLLTHLHKLDRFDKVVIWSGEHRAWWNPGGNGYTDDIKEAGQFSAKDAWRRVAHCSPEKRIVLLGRKG